MEIISLKVLNLSFSDLGCFNLEFEILQSKIGCELIELHTFTESERKVVQGGPSLFI